MKYLYTLLLGLVLALGFATDKAEALGVDPIAGPVTGSVSFDLGDATVFFAGDDTLEFTLAHTSVLDITLTDCCLVDDFSLLINGATTAWVEAYPTFSVSGLVLLAGSYTLDFAIDTYCCTTASGGFASYSISAAAVPLPAGLPLLLLGLGALGVARRRKSA